MAPKLADLQPLLDQFKGEGLVVSCYADFSSFAKPRITWPGPFKVKATAAENMLATDPRARRDFERNFQAIARALDLPEMRQAPGMAVFAALERGFFQVFALEEAPENDLVVHQSPYLVPLLEMMVRQRSYLVVVSNTHRSRLYSATPAEVHLLAEVDEEVPRKQHSCGERWGKEQATIARRREECIRHHLHELVKRIERLWAEQSFQGMVFLGEHELLEHLRKELPHRLACHVLSERPLAWMDDLREIDNAVRETLADHLKMEEKSLTETIERRLQQGYAMAVGPHAVLDAVQTGRVGPRGHGYLVLGPDPREVVARCTACRSLFVNMPDTCPRCQAHCVEGNLWEELLMLALRHQIVARCLKSSAALASHDGVVAVLAEPTGAPFYPTDSTGARRSDARASVTQ